MSISDFQSEVVKSNLDVGISNYNIEKAETALDQLRSNQIPDIKINYTALTTNSPLMAFGSKLNQERVSQEDFNPAILNDPDRIENFNTEVSIQKGVLNLDLKPYQQAAQSQIKAQQFSKQRLIEGLHFQASQYYFQLQLLTKQLIVLESSLSTLSENERVANQMYEQGLMQKADLLNISVKISEVENAIISTKGQISIMSRNMSVLMNKNFDKLIVPSDALTKQEYVWEGLGISESRSDFMAMNQALEAYNHQMHAIKNSSLPRVAAFASYNLNDNNPIKFRGESYMLGINLSWNILSGLKQKSKIDQVATEKKIVSQQYEKMLRESQSELFNAIKQLEDADNAILLAAKAMDQSKEVLRIRTDRYNEGIEKVSDLLLAENQFKEKQLAYYAAIFSYNLKVSHIEFLLRK